MPKVINGNGIQLIMNVVNQLIVSLGQARFTYKGQRYKLASPELIELIGNTCQKLMEKVELTDSELTMLLGRDDVVTKLVGSLTLDVKNGDLPTQENVKPTGLAGLFFNAMIYNAKINVARVLPARQSEDSNYAPMAGAATLDRLDILKSPREKDVARVMHETIASMMELSAAQELLVTLIAANAHDPVVEQLRVEYGMQGVRSAPLALFKSYLSKAQPVVTGDTKTWQNTVLAVLQIVSQKYFEAIAAAAVGGVEGCNAVRATLQEPGGYLVRVLTDKMSEQEDAKFVRSCITERDRLMVLLGLNSAITTQLSNDNNNTLLSSSVLQLESTHSESSYSSFASRQRQVLRPSLITPSLFVDNNNYDNDDDGDDYYSSVPATASDMYGSHIYRSEENEVRFMQQRLVSESVTPYGELIRRVATLLADRLKACNFAYKGKHFMLITETQKTRIREKCKELMAGVMLTEVEKQLLTHIGGELHTENLQRLAELIVSTIDLSQADGALPNKDNVTTSGLTGLFFNAMLYRPNIGAAFITAAVNSTTELNEDSDLVANSCTLDRMMPIRVKEVAHCVHVAMATVMNREQVQDLLIILRNQFVHPATQQLRVEYGMHGLRNPIDFASSFLNTEKVATGDTHTWQVTVLEVAEQARLKYVNEVAEANNLDKSDGAPQLAALATSSDALIAELEKKVPPCKDDAFAAKWEFKKGEFTALFYRVERSPVAANYKFD